MSVLNLLWCVAVFWVLMFGLGLPLTVGRPLRADEKIALAPGAALIVIYLAAFAIYCFNLPPWAYLALPAAALAGLAGRSRQILAVVGDPEARRLLGALAVGTGWGIGLLGLVRCYFGVGAGATGDWVEHFQRTCFFLGRWPLNYRFIWLYPLPARPPLANLTTGAFMALSSETFPFFQVFSTLESLLVLLPGWLLCRRWGGGRTAGYTFLLLSMLNPLLMQNATYPWTKLITAYFVVAGLQLYLRGRDCGSAGFFRASFLFLSAGLLAHYSAGPYLLVLALCYLFAARKRWFTPSFAASTGRMVLPAVLLLATWFGWSWTHYGPGATVLSNTAVTGAHDSSWRTLVGIKVGNFGSSMLPRPLWDPAYVPPGPEVPAVAQIDQRFFLFYQLTLPFAFGFAGVVILPWRLVRKWPAGPPSGFPDGRGFWTCLLAGTILLGILVNGARDHNGLANVCLQPLVVLGLAFLAAEIAAGSRLLRGVFWAGLALDFTFGVVLHFYVEHRGLSLVQPDALAPANPGPLWTQGFLSNLLAKYYFGLKFLGDGGPPAGLVTAFLAGLLALVLWWQVRIATTAPGAPPSFPRSFAS